MPTWQRCFEGLHCDIPCKHDGYAAFWSPNVEFYTLNTGFQTGIVIRAFSDSIILLDVRY